MYDFLSDDYIREKKAKIRKSKRKARASFGGQARSEADEFIYENFVTLGFIEKNESFFVYNSVNSEADTKKLIKTLLTKGKAVYLPRVVGKEMEAVPYSGKFVKSPFGIEEPMGDAYRGKIDVAVIPGFAFNLHGDRIGYGGGYYDRFLSDRKIVKIGYCYDFQIVQSIPVERHDVPVDYLVTDKRCRKFLSDRDIGMSVADIREADEESARLGAIAERVSARSKAAKKNKETKDKDETEDN